MSPIIRVGIIGAGEVAQAVWLPTLTLLSHLYKVVAICDLSQQSIDHCANKFHIPKTFLDRKDLLKEQDVDLVMILASDEYHVSLAVEAADAGKHVFIEKPIALTEKGAQTIADAQDRNKVVIMIGYMRRYAPAFNVFKSILAASGPVLYARVRDIIGPNVFFVKQSGSYPSLFTDFPPDASQERLTLNTSAMDEALGQGHDPDLAKIWRFLGNIGSHDLSLMREALGMPNRVIAASSFGSGHPFFLNVLFQMSEGYTCSYETGLDTIGRFDAHIQVYCEKATVKIQYDTPYVKGLPITITVSEQDGNGRFQERLIRPTYEDPYTVEIKELYEALNGGPPVKTTPAEARADIQLNYMVIQALEKEFKMKG